VYHGASWRLFARDAAPSSMPHLLRSSLALSLVTGKPFVIQTIRGHCKKPGFMRQHLIPERPMIRPCSDNDFDAIYTIVNDAAEAYRGVIPEDRWHEPYMSENELRREIQSGVRFWGFEEDGELLGVMGIQDARPTLLRGSFIHLSSFIIHHFPSIGLSPLRRSG
jgi:RNA 3'-terminal phosphate cyclase